MYNQVYALLLYEGFFLPFFLRIVLITFNDYTDNNDFKYIA